MPKSIKENHSEFINLAESFVEKDTRIISRQDIVKVCQTHNLPFPHWLTVEKSYDAGRGLYILPSSDGRFNPADPDAEIDDPSMVDFEYENSCQEEIFDENEVTAGNVISNVITVAGNASSSQTLMHEDPASGVGVMNVNTSFIPTKLKGYVKYGDWGLLHRLVKSRKFFPTFICGDTGCGKTLMIKELCADLGRDFVRANITTETDESDLLGSFRLVNGDTVWEHGPVVQAMLRGAILLLDEIDLGGSRLMCLQPVLEGEPIFLKKINQWIYPADGFQVFATSNTNGKGSDDGRFIGTNILNEALLDRFPLNIEQDYPPKKVEARICKNVLSRNGIDVVNENHDDVINVMIEWVSAVRKLFAEDVISNQISTRRLVNILDFYSIFRETGKDSWSNIRNAIKTCITRFDEIERGSFLDAFDKLIPAAPPANPAPSTTTQPKKAPNSNVVTTDDVPW